MQSTSSEWSLASVFVPPLVVSLFLFSTIVIGCLICRRRLILLLAGRLLNLERANFLRNFFCSEMFYQSEPSVKSKGNYYEPPLRAYRDAAEACTAICLTCCSWSISSEKTFGWPDFSENKPTRTTTRYNYDKTYSASSCRHRLYRSIQRFRSGSDTSPESREGSGYGERIPNAVPREEDASPHTCRSA